MVDLNPNISISTLNVSSLNTSIKTNCQNGYKNHLIRCYLKETQFKYNDMGRQKVKDRKRCAMQILIKGKLEWFNMRNSRLYTERETNTVYFHLYV